ncbi:hypothetical protein [Mesorhizobium sp.]|uniref:hypothetical protein n=1 Tax=Mesorhizobium sp. TaxID=1871066 RepID=UPI0012110457|nr:hypothetical protein [Mesorhizobium sp.]TIO07765.1 MAG: hypothetical protein E5X88_17090 [Mesorhizobium sp.]TIO30936.1 MAG: hypothetical protein E5X89_25675 [Mesorhizobium sp.]TIP08713.1 MAG: hypothetical protein E5X73_30795 [Mesorhizobium sp.]
MRVNLGRLTLQLRLGIRHSRFAADFRRSFLLTVANQASLVISGIARQCAAASTTARAGGFSLGSNP